MFFAISSYLFSHSLTEAPGNRGVVQFGMDGLLGVATSVASF
jgi:hypothetical protein